MPGTLLRTMGNTLPIFLRLGVNMRIAHYLHSSVAPVDAVADSARRYCNNKKESQPVSRGSAYSRKEPWAQAHTDLLTHTPTHELQSS